MAEKMDKIRAEYAEALKRCPYGLTDNQKRAGFELFKIVVEEERDKLLKARKEFKEKMFGSLSEGKSSLDGEEV